MYLASTESNFASVCCFALSFIHVCLAVIQLMKWSWLHYLHYFPVHCHVACC